MSDGHAHVGVMFGLTVISWIIVANFLARTWAGLKPDNPALKGLHYNL